MPYGVMFSQFTPLPTVRFIKPPIMKTSLFSGEVNTYYKPYSLASGGVGSVRNSGAKGRRT
jgi:hypothetical protein